MSKNQHHPKLTFVGEPFDGRVCNLELETTTVGRSSGNHLTIRDPSVSAKHCEILVHDSEVIVRDLNSSNGTFINAARIDGQAQLKHGQVVRFGNVNARLELPSREATHSSSEATAIYEHARFTREARAEREHPKPPPQPVELDAAGRPDTEHTVSLRRERPEHPHATSQAKPQRQASTKPVRKQWIILGGLVVAAAILWWFLRK